MSKTPFLFLALAVFLPLVAGCGKIAGPRFWWDDRGQERLEEYSLPENPGAPSDFGDDRRSAASGEDITDNDIRDYRTNLDIQEEKRQVEDKGIGF
jgi:hypothetical protein